MRASHTNRPQPLAQPIPINLSRWLWAVALVSLVFRWWLSAALPLTGDEALFYWWARFLDYGYYDHPPMVAWWIATVRALFGDATWALRLPMLVLPLGVGAAMWWAWAGLNRERTAWAVLFYWLMPMNWVNTLITTDSPLILWAAWSAAAMVRAEQKADQGQAAWGLYALSGLFMGAAFLSKYFAVLLGLAYAVYFLVSARSHWRGLMVMALCTLPAVGVNALWNLNHCWANIMFNVFNRNEDAVYTLDKPMAYVAMLAYLITPVALYWAVRYRDGLVKTLREQPLLSCMALVPLLCFGLMSGKKVIGIHWVLGFYPFLFVILAFMLPAARLQQAKRGMALFLAMHVLVVLAVAQTHLSQWQGVKYYNRLVEALRIDAVAKQVNKPGVVLMSTAYSSASLLGYAVGHHVPVFGMGSVHARQDDLMVDYAQFNGQTLRIVQQSEPDMAEFNPYFDKVRVLSYQQDGQPFYAIEGQGFRYEVYRQKVVSDINQRYYRFPAWLPVWGCAFCVHYCGAQRCQH